jgi:hypothetical protein
LTATSNYELDEEQAKVSATVAQVAWTKHHQSFEKWKTENPAVMPIIANINNDMTALKAAEKQKAERDEFVSEISHKSERQQKVELEKYDKFTYLIKQSRQRELWRNRVETQIKVQGMIEAQRQAVIDEQERIVAEAERKKAEAEAEEARKKEEEERKVREAEAEEERKKELAGVEAKEAEDAKILLDALTAMLAESVDGEKIQQEANNATNAQLGTFDGLFSDTFSVLEYPQMTVPGHFLNEVLNGAGQQPVQQGVLGKVTAPSVPANTSSENFAAVGVQQPQIVGPDNVQDFQF